MKSLYFVFFNILIPIVLLFQDFNDRTYSPIRIAFEKHNFFINSGLVDLLTVVLLVIFVYSLYASFVSICAKRNLGLSNSTKPWSSDLISLIIPSLIISIIYVIWILLLAEVGTSYTGITDGFGLFSLLFSMPSVSVAYIIGFFVLRKLYLINVIKLEIQRPVISIFLKVFKIRFVTYTFAFATFLLIFSYFYSQYSYNSKVKELRTSSEIMLGDIVSKESVYYTGRSPDSGSISYYLGEKYLIKVSFPVMPGEQWWTDFPTTQIKLPLKAKLLGSQGYIQANLSSNDDLSVYLQHQAFNSPGTIELFVGLPNTIAIKTSTIDKQSIPCIVEREKRLRIIHENPSMVQSHNSATVSLDTYLSHGRFDSVIEHLKSKEYHLTVDVDQLNTTLGSTGLYSCLDTNFKPATWKTWYDPYDVWRR